MSSHKRAEPTAVVAKLLFKGIGLYTVGSTFASGLNSFLIVVGQKGENMLFTTANWILYIGLAFGIILCILLAYYFKYQVYQQKHPDKKLQFEVRYVVAAFCTLIAATIVAYVIMFFGLGYVAPETEITQDSVAFLIAFAVGGFTTFILDACLFHPLVDGSAAMAFNKAQEKIREELASKEAQEAFSKLIVERANALGLNSDKKIEMLKGMVGEKGIDDPNFPALVAMLINAPEQ